MVRDFTRETEERLVRLANEAEELQNMLERVSNFMRRWLHIPSFLVLKRVNSFGHTVLDFYRYAGKTIRRIFRQARSCDKCYQYRLSSYVNTIDQSAEMLKRLADAIEPSSAISSIAFAIRLAIDERFLLKLGPGGMLRLVGCPRPRYILRPKDINLGNEEYVDILKDENILIDYAVPIYEIMQIKIGSGRELLELFGVYTKEEVQQFPNGYIPIPRFPIIRPIVIDPNRLIAVLGIPSEMTGTSERIHGYAWLTALRELEVHMHKKYVAALTALKSVDLDAEEIPEEVGPFNEMFGVMQAIQINIQEVYRDMFPEDPEIRMSCNDRIAELEGMRLVENIETISD